MTRCRLALVAVIALGGLVGCANTFPPNAMVPKQIRRGHYMQARLYHAEQPTQPVGEADLRYNEPARTALADWLANTQLTAPPDDDDGVIFAGDRVVLLELSGRQTTVNISTTTEQLRIAGDYFKNDAKRMHAAVQYLQPRASP